MDVDRGLSAMIRDGGVRVWVESLRSWADLDMFVDQALRLIEPALSPQLKDLLESSDGRRLAVVVHCVTTVRPGSPAAQEIDALIERFVGLRSDLDFVVAAVANDNAADVFVDAPTLRAARLLSALRPALDEALSDVLQQLVFEELELEPGGDC